MWRHTLERQHEHCLLRHWRLLHHHGTIATGQRLHCHLPVSLSWLVHTIQALQGRNIEKNGIILILKTCKFTQQVVRWWYMRCVSLHRCEKHSRCVGWNIASMWKGEDFFRCRSQWYWKWLIWVNASEKLTLFSVVLMAVQVMGWCHHFQRVRCFLFYTVSLTREGAH